MRRIERVIAGPEVAMAASLRERPAAIEQARHPVQQAIFDGQRQANVSAAYVAECGETPVQAGVQELGGKMRQVRNRRLNCAGDVQSSGIDVDVSVDKPGHQHAAATINDLRGAVSLDPPLGKLADHAVSNDYIQPLAKIFGVAVKDSR